MEARSDEVVARLKQSLGRWEDESRGRGDEVSPGAGWNDLFPQGSLRRGTLVEWLREADGGPAEAVSLGVAGRLASDEGGTLVVVDPDKTFFPPAAAALGIDPSSIAIVRPRDEREALWAFDQALRSRAVSIVWGRLERLPGRAYRRLQLSAEEGGTIGFLSRSARTRSQAAWCEGSFVVRPIVSGDASRCFRIEVVRSRDGTTGRTAAFAWDGAKGISKIDVPSEVAERRDSSDDSHPLHLVSPLGRAASSSRRVERKRASGSS